MPTLHVRIPDDRIGVLIGAGGETKRMIESRTATQIMVDPDDGEVEITARTEGDPDGVLRARDVVLAVGRGFSPQRAERLLKGDTYLAVLDIKEVTGKREKAALRRIRSRVIGEHGRARTRIEELSGCSVSVYGTTVAIIGQERQLERASRAVQLLLRGSEHAAVFHLLARLREEANLSEATEPLEPSDTS
ncbi:MAG TPA: KH domain-containing protein [Thermoplasmata archaeon]|nr:KH domain-containing protein [Thermoplasmata archaeon]